MPNKLKGILLDIDGTLIDSNLGVRCGGWPAKDLKGALAVYDDPADFLAHLDDLSGLGL